VSDGVGGAIVVWEDSRSGQGYDVYARRVDAPGNPLWTADGVAVCTATGFQSAAQLTSDGSGGAIIAWQDNRSDSYYDIYARRVDDSGNALWTADGVALCTAVFTQFAPQIISDSAGGAIVTWRDNRDAPYDYDIYAQRIDASGNVLWATNGVALCAAASDQGDPFIVSDGSGGAIVAWKDYRNGESDIYAQRIDSAGNSVWTANGVAICTATSYQSGLQIASDGAGGAVITWQDERTGWEIFDIYAQRILAGGSTLWTLDGVAVCAADGDQVSPQIVNDGSGGAIVTWEDRRSVNGTDIYARRVSATGAALWAPDGVAVCTATDSQGSPQVVGDGAAGAIVTWYDIRQGLQLDVYAQRINPSGGALWVVDGAKVCDAPGNQYFLRTATDMVGGVIVSWEDTRSGAPEIYAQRVAAIGSPPTGLGDVPRLTGLTLQPNVPNPFTGVTTLHVGLEARSNVSLEVYDVTGQRVVHRELGVMDAGWTGVSFDGRDDDGRALASGVYFYRVIAGSFTHTRKMTLLR